MPMSMTGMSSTNVHMPVQAIDTDDETKPLNDGTGLCLSGGGYRAMVFHVGVLWRLFDSGLLPRLERISSVSGGSITAAVLALKWPKLMAAGAGLAVFEAELAMPIRQMASTSIDIMAGIKGLLLPGRISDKVADAYDKHLFHGATLQHFPTSLALSSMQRTFSRARSGAS